MKVKAADGSKAKAVSLRKVNKKKSKAVNNSQAS